MIQQFYADRESIAHAHQQLRLLVQAAEREVLDIVRHTCVDKKGNKTYYLANSIPFGCTAKHVWM